MVADQSIAFCTYLYTTVPSHGHAGQPKRHLLTTGWSVFVSTKRLLAGDSVLFIRDEKSQLLLGIRRATRPQPALSSSVLSSDSMHIGILAAAAHAAANSSPFTIFYNPRYYSSYLISHYPNALSATLWDYELIVVILIGQVHQNLSFL
jgi:hypothetical protein